MLGRACYALICCDTFALLLICTFDEQELAEHTTEVNVQHENLDGIFTFYDSTKATLNIYQVFCLLWMLCTVL